MNKPIHAKPSLYAFYFELLKEIAISYGYNLVLHGSMNRDLDLIAIPWIQELGSVEEMIKEFADKLGGTIMEQTHEQRHCFAHGRLGYVININRGEIEFKKSDKPFVDPEYFIDISIIPVK